MKKVIFIFVALIYMGLSASSQNVSGSYTVPSGSLNVDYYNDRCHDSNKNGRLVITNNSDLTISKAHIYVTVFITWYEQSKRSSYPIKNTKTLELCDDDFYDIPSHKMIELTSSKRGVVKGGPEKDGKTYQYSIQITDVVLEPVPFPEP